MSKEAFTSKDLCRDSNPGNMEKVTPEKAKAILEQQGMNVSLEQAALILEFLRKMASIIVTAYLEKARKS